MAGQEPYGNWLRLPPRRGAAPPGICSGGGQMSPVGSFRPDSPDSFSDEDEDEDEDEDDYDDVSVPAAPRRPREPPAPHDLPGRRSGAGAGVYILAGKPEPSSPAGAGLAERGARRRRGCPEKPVVTLYVLLGLSFVVWAALLLLAVLKYSELSRELKTLSSNYSQSMLQELAERQRGQARMSVTMAAYHQELQNVTALVCRALEEPQRCPPGWRRFEQSCYSFSTESRSWEEARRLCEERSAHLLVVNTDREQKFLKDNVDRGSSYWLGLRLRPQDGSWRWVDGQRLSLSYWRLWAAERAPERRDCGSVGPDALWSEERCRAPLRWVCERPRGCRQRPEPPREPPIPAER